MAITYAELQRHAQELEGDRGVQLAESLLESMRKPIADIEPAWAAEIESRVADHDRGEVETHSAQDVFAEARSLWTNAALLHGNDPPGQAELTEARLSMPTGFLTPE